jgi:hypothetical protein
MRRSFIIAGAIVAMVLGGCDRVRETVGLTKRAPDEFTVVTKAPLVIPPNFSLRPPQPGARRPQETQPRDRARRALVSSGRGGQAAAAASVPEGSSGGEGALLKQAGALDADPSIRATIDRETTQMAEQDSSFAERLIFWQDKPAYGSTLDAEKEAKRLRENAAAGRPVTEGDTPVIKRRKRGILEGIF